MIDALHTMYKTFIFSSVLYLRRWDQGFLWNDVFLYDINRLQYGAIYKNTGKKDGKALISLIGRFQKLNLFGKQSET